MFRLLPIFALALGCQQTGGGGGNNAAGDGAASGDGALTDGGAGGEDDAQAGDAGTPDAASNLPDPVCTDGTRYTAGTSAFVERTLEVGLEGVEGTRLSVADVDGDGWADVMVRRGGRRSDLLQPDGPRHHWLLRNNGGTFEDLTEASGFLAVRGNYPLPMGRPIEVVAFADFDNDGDLDAYSGLDTREAVLIETEEASFQVAETSEVLINDGSGTFTLAEPGHTLRRLPSLAVNEDVPSGAAFVDFDRDGQIDLWMSQGGLGAPLQDRLYRNNDGTWTDATAPAQLRTEEWEVLADLNAGRAHTTAWGAAACDLNDDGHLELLAASYGRAPNHLWQANGDGTFTNRSVDSGYAYDDDQDWTTDQFARCYCRSNPGATGCDGVPAPAVQCSDRWRPDLDNQPFRLGGNSGATVCADFDNDGHIDLFTTEIKHWWAGSASDAGELLHNTGAPDVTFIRPGRLPTGLDIPHQAGTSWDEGHITAGSFDFDNDGFEDIYVGATDYPGNRGRLYHNVSTPGEPAFDELPTDDFFEHNRSHGMAVADFDHDGDLDLIVGHSRARGGAPNDRYPTMQVRYFENTLGQSGNWIQLRLEGEGGVNRAAIGARVTVTTDDFTATQEVAGGYGHFGAQEDLVLHFGLGASCDAQVTVRWPDADLTTETFRVVSGHRYDVKPGAGPVAQEQ